MSILFSGKFLSEVFSQLISINKSGSKTICRKWMETLLLLFRLKVSVLLEHSFVLFPFYFGQNEHKFII